MSYFVTATHTDAGKTLVSAILVEKTGYRYWKPIQAGYPTDTSTVESILQRKCSIPEKYLLKTPMSPHAAANIEGIKIKTKDFQLPAEDLIVEGAGGVLAPISDTEYAVSLIEHLELEVILVSDNYLGSINHTMLTINELKRRGVKIKGIIFNGDEAKESEEFILKNSGLECLLRVPRLEKIELEVIRGLANKLIL